MKYVLIIIALFIFLYGFIGFGKYVADYGVLSAYGQGYVYGNALLMLVGVLVLFWAIRRKQ